MPLIYQKENYSLFIADHIAWVPYLNKTVLNVENKIHKILKENKFSKQTYSHFDLGHR